AAKEATGFVALHDNLVQGDIASMKMTCMTSAVLLFLSIILVWSTPLQAQSTPASDSAAPPANASSAGPTAADSAIMTRLADLEAYVNNTGPKALVNVPGPGHNA